MRIIAGHWGGRTIAAPPGDRTRPTTERVREAWMSRLQHDIPGARVLDLFAGSGALGLEALSRGAVHVTFVERGAGALRALEANIRALHAGAHCAVVRTDALKYVDTLDANSFDIVFADPPYGSGEAERLVTAFERTAFASILCIEHSARSVLSDAAAASTRRYGDIAITFITAPQ
jgi:16S rRNA (guanine966-N2)-methyltransferase